MILAIELSIELSSVNGSVFRRIGLEAYDKIDRMRFDKVNEMRLKAGLEILQYSDRLMIMAQQQAEMVARSGLLNNPIPSVLKKRIHARVLRYVGEITTTGRLLHFHLFLLFFFSFFLLLLRQ
jgi:hypothetical protein